MIQKKKILRAASHKTAPTAAPIRALTKRTRPEGIRTIISSSAKKMKIEGKIPVRKERVLLIS
ncbi:hypothetical protein ES708_15503 [subsurface metagenome]